MSHPAVVVFTVKDSTPPPRQRNTQVTCALQRGLPRSLKRCTRRQSVLSPYCLEVKGVTHQMRPQPSGQNLQISFPNRKQQMSVQHYQHRLLRKCWLSWQHYTSLERQRKAVLAEQDATKNKMAAFLQAAGSSAVFLPLFRPSTTKSGRPCGVMNVSSWIPHPIPCQADPPAGLTPLARLTPLSRDGGGTLPLRR